MLFEKIARIRFVVGVCLFFFLVRNVYLYSQSDTFFFSFQVLKTVRQLKDKGQTHASMLLYGHGDCQVYKSKLVLTHIICHSNIFLSLFFVLTQGLHQSGLKQPGIWFLL